MPVLHFDEARHLYTLDGRQVPGVTTALKVISAADYAMVDPELLAVKARFGQAVHRMIELDCLGELDLASLDDDLVPYYLAWREFLATSGFRVLLSESKVCSARYGYAGQLDLFGHLNGIAAMVDAKCVACIMPSTGPQTAGYENALRESRPDLLPTGTPCRRYALQLRPSAKPGAAKWHLVPFTGTLDFRAFLSCLTISQWRATV